MNDFLSSTIGLGFLFIMTMQKEMNGYDLSRKWFDFCFENTHVIKPNHTALYFFIIEHCNRLGWRDKFGLPTSMVMEAIGIKSYNTYKNTLQDIVSFGFVKIITPSKNQYSSNVVALLKFDKALDKALDKAIMKHLIKQSESTHQSIDSIIKPLTINKETINYNTLVKNIAEEILKNKNYGEFTEQVNDNTSQGERPKFTGIKPILQKDKRS